ncbi:ATP-binding protein [Kitasatospora cheerisanensis]|uniref:ATP-binding protein n=1 Tax=Kitasatospora cheerisanensis TaxID=81942 RepID=UPI0012ECC47C|nr:hypothetical protein [Kitasatospora cheerisanensis]
MRDARLLAPAVLAALDPAGRTARPSPQALAERLAGRRLLLVLDGCEQLADACAELVGALLRAAPGLRVLATSRQSLRAAGEHLLPLAPLPVEPAAGRADSEAALLFADRAAAVRPGFRLEPANRAAVARLCRRLDGLPLALELAGGRLRALSVEQLAARLDDRFQLLAGGGPAVPARHRTMRTAIGWSHELCTVQERLLWARLSVFADGFDLDAAEYVCAGAGLPVDDVLDLLDALVDKSVLERLDGDPARFRMLDTLREYGAHWLRAGDEGPRLLRRHRDWYLGVADWGEVEWFGPQQAETAERTRLAHPNLRAALEFSLTEPGEEQPALALAAALWYFWAGTGRLGEGRHWLDRALALAPEPTGARAKALWATGHLAALQGDPAAPAPPWTSAAARPSTPATTGPSPAPSTTRAAPPWSATTRPAPPRSSRRPCATTPPSASSTPTSCWPWSNSPSPTCSSATDRAAPPGRPAPANSASSTANGGPTATACTPWRTPAGSPASPGRPAPSPASRSG